MSRKTLRTIPQNPTSQFEHIILDWYQTAINLQKPREERVAGLYQLDMFGYAELLRHDTYGPNGLIAVAIYRVDGRDIHIESKQYLQWYVVPVHSLRAR